MSRSAAILGPALVISLIFNIVAFRRVRQEPSTSSARDGRAAAAGGAEGVETRAGAQGSESVKAELERERKRARELEEKVKRLEADREVLAQAATSAAAAGSAAPKSPTAGLREKLRKMKKIFDAAEDGAQPDQEAVMEMSGEIMEIMKLGLARGKDPATYAEFLKACAEVSLEDKAALTPAQSADLGRVLDAMAGELGQIAATTSGERLIRELEIESGAVARMQALLTPEQREVMKKGGMDDMPSMASGMSTTYLTKAGAVDTIVKQWTQSYKLDAAQLPAARAAATSFLSSLEGFDTSLKPGAQNADSNWGQMSYETRIGALRAQLTALRTLEGAMTAEQFERLRTQTTREFRLMDVQLQAVETPEKK